MSGGGSSGSHDCIVIGAGHNGLVCAALLARSGRRVLVLEAAGQVGGAAVTREFAAGFRVSAGAHLLHLMPAMLLAELELERHGLTYAARALPSTALIRGAEPLALDAAGIAARSARDAAAWTTFGARLERFAAVLYAVLAAEPPRLGRESWSDALSFARLGWRLRRRGRRDLRELLRIIGMNVYDLLEDEFETAALKGALGFDAVLGSNYGPRAPGTVLTCLYRLAAEWGAGARPGRPSLALPAGGLGALSAALARAATAAGATIRTGAVVARIRVRDDRAAGVELASGEVLDARTVVSSADPKTTFLGLLGTEYLDTGFVRRVDHSRALGVAAKLHLALERLPEFPGLTRTALGGRLLIAPSLQYIERAWNHVKYGESSAAPVLELTLPSLHDPSLAPAGRHVLSAIVQYAPYRPAGGWDSERPRLLRALIELLDAHAPGLKSSISAAELLTPADLEREFRIAGGHWHHGELAFDQFWMVRPFPGAAQYRTPLAGLYLCGAGCHPGGGVMGLAGRNAARVVAATD